MSKKLKGGLVYSTDPHFNPAREEEAEETPPTAQQKLRVRLETKQRGGKEATMISGFIGHKADLEALLKMLKTKFGTGGSVKEGEILIQGSWKEKIIEHLKNIGYTQTK